MFSRCSRFYKKHLWMISIILSCCSAVILLSEGKHSPRRKISAPMSTPDPLMYAFVRPLPFPSAVMKAFVRYIGCICMGFQIAHVTHVTLASYRLLVRSGLFHVLCCFQPIFGAIRIFLQSYTGFPNVTHVTSVSFPSRAQHKERFLSSTERIFSSLG